MKKLLKFSVVFLVICLALTGCEKNDQPEIPQNEKIALAYQTIKVSADSILLSKDPIGGFAKMKKEYEKLDGVEIIGVSKDGLLIKFINGAEIVWLVTNNGFANVVPISKSIQQDFSNTSLRMSTKSSTSTQNALIINQVYNDENFAYVKNTVLALKGKMEANNWLVTVKNGHDANLDFFKNGLSGYDALFIITHGVNIYGFGAELAGLFGYQGGATYMITGETATNIEFWLSYFDKNEGSAYSFDVFVGRLPEIHIVNGEKKEVTVDYYGIKPKYITKHYSTSSFSNCWVYNGCCYGMGSKGNQDLTLAKAFVENGAKIYFGWEEANCLGPISGYHLFSQLLLGNTFEETWSYLNNYKIEGETFKNLLMQFMPVSEEWSNLDNSKINGTLLQYESYENNTLDGSATLKYYTKDPNINNIRLVEPPAVDDEGLTEDIHNIIPEEYIEILKELGLEINGGNTPPNIEGTYLATPLELVKNMAAGNRPEQWDMYITFNNQNNSKLTIDADYTMKYEGAWWSVETMSSKGPGSFIVGQGNKFTVFVDARRTSSTTSVTAKTVEIFSGEILPEGIKNFHWAVIMIDDNGDPDNVWIDNGECYMKKDADGLSPRVSTGTRSSSASSPMKSRKNAVMNQEKTCP